MAWQALPSAPQEDAEEDKRMKRARITISSALSVVFSIRTQPIQVEADSLDPDRAGA
jgi:hypothetical protein